MSCMCCKTLARRHQRAAAEMMTHMSRQRQQAHRVPECGCRTCAARGTTRTALPYTRTRTRFPFRMLCSPQLPLHPRSIRTRSDHHAARAIAHAHAQASTGTPAPLLQTLPRSHAPRDILPIAESARRYMRRHEHIHMYPCNEARCAPLSSAMTTWTFTAEPPPALNPLQHHAATPTLSLIHI